MATSGVTSASIQGQCHEEARLCAKTIHCRQQVSAGEAKPCQALGRKRGGGLKRRRHSKLRRGAPSSIAASKRKREERKTKVVSKEAAEALEAREAAKRRVAEREKPCRGLYSSYCLFVQQLQQQIVVSTK